MDALAPCFASGPAVVPDLRTLIPDLRALAAEIDDLSAPNEAAFLTVGNALGLARQQFMSLEDHFVAFLSLIQSDRAGQGAELLTATVDQSAALAVIVADIGDYLKKIDASSGAINAPLAELLKIIGEIATLAINARIQAAQVASGGIDFSVFTSDIGRMGAAAARVVRQGGGRLKELAAVVARAVALQNGAASDDDREIADIRSHGAARLAEIARRRQRSQSVLGDLGVSRDAIAGEIAACIGRLQINDMTSQRIAHCREALELACRLIDGDGGEEFAWAAELDPQQRAALVSTVCRLQARQLEKAVVEFAVAAGDLKDRLGALSRQAMAAKSRALDVLGETGSAGGGGDDMRRDGERVRAILLARIGAGEQIRSMVGTVAGLLETIVADMASIRSIDADMRLMGLNASLKCARLGNAGRALAVVAQELRTSSLRTVDILKTIAANIDVIRHASDSLEQKADQRRQLTAGLSASIDQWVEAVAGVGRDIDGALAPIWRTCDDVAGLLAGAADEITVHERLERQSRQAVARLTAIADTIQPDPTLGEAIIPNVMQLLEGHYTMASERMIHNLFADGPSDFSAPTVANDDSDDFFL